MGIYNGVSRDDSDDSYFPCDGQLHNPYRGLTTGYDPIYNMNNDRINPSPMAKRIFKTPASLLNVELHNAIAPLSKALDSNPVSQGAVVNVVRRIIEQYQMQFGEPIMVTVKMKFRDNKPYVITVESSLWIQNNRYAQKPQGVEIEVNEPVEDEIINKRYEQLVGGFEI